VPPNKSHPILLAWNGHYQDLVIRASDFLGPSSPSKMNLYARFSDTCKRAGLVYNEER
jgi:hypothetical protein